MNHCTSTIGLAAVLVLAGAPPFPRGRARWPCPYGEDFRTIPFRRRRMPAICSSADRHYCEAGGEELPCAARLSAPPSVRLPAPRSAAGAARVGAGTGLLFGSRGGTDASQRSATVASGGTTTPTSSGTHAAATRSGIRRDRPVATAADAFQFSLFAAARRLIPGRFPNRRRAAATATAGRSTPAPSPAGPQRAA